MRYYDLTITSQSGATVGHVTSHPNGLLQPPDPGALDVEFDFFVYPYAQPLGGSTVTIYGISLNALSGAQQFAGMNCTFKAGMGKGLPLAKPQQAGLMFDGLIFQSFGNWVGIDMTLDLVLNASKFTYDEPGLFLLSWGAGTPLQPALAQMLSAAYPGMKQTIQISSSLVLPQNEWHYCSTLAQMAAYINGLTAGLLGPTYNGVNIAINGGQFFVWDGTNNEPTVTLAFEDLIGQPTWIDVNQIQVKTVMRADIQVNQIIQMPPNTNDQPGFVTTTATSQPSNIKYQTQFKGQFQVRTVRQVGHFRSSDATQWATVLNCVPVLNAG